MSELLWKADPPFSVNLWMTGNFWETLSKNHPAKPLLIPKETAKTEILMF
jgi:hypothetical protein